MRLDVFLTLKGYFESRNKSLAAIKDGKISVNGEKIFKPSYYIEDSDNPEIISETEKDFVSVGGEKLFKAINDFGYSVKGKTVVDAGASTGGFTDCLLRLGAEKVYAIDVTDCLHPTLKKDKRVVEIIKNVRYLTQSDFPNGIDLITADLSFISVNSVLDVFYSLLPQDGEAIILIKPQFEIGKRTHFKNGIIKDKKFWITACGSVIDKAREIGFFPLNITTAPLKEEKNREFLLLLGKKCGLFSLDDFFRTNNFY